jgi:hypothetical protein
MLSNNPEAVAEPPARYAKDEKLWGLLPSKDDPYFYDKLSKAETDAFVEALGDGFGYPAGGLPVCSGSGAFADKAGQQSRDQRSPERRASAAPLPAPSSCARCREPAPSLDAMHHSTSARFS